MGQLFDTLASKTTETASKATEKAVHATTEAAEEAAKKAKVAAIKASNDMRHSMTNAKRDAKEKGEQYAWEAHRTMHRVGEDAKKSAKSTATKTSEKVKASLSDVSQSAVNRLKKEVAKRMPKIPSLPKLPFSRSQLQSTTKEATERISYAMPSKETRKALVESASHIASETVTKTASNVTTQVQEGVNKATRWLWWWGLAAVGVYGVSTTLTREGVQALKDMFSSKKSLGSDSALAVADSVNSTVASQTAEADDGNASSGRWLSSWFPRASEKASKATEKVVHATTEAAEVTAEKAMMAATKATNDMRHSVINAKKDAKQKGEQYAWEAHRTIHRVGEDVKQSAKSTATKTSEKVKEFAGLGIGRSDDNGEDPY